MRDSLSERIMDVSLGLRHEAVALVATVSDTVLLSARRQPVLSGDSVAEQLGGTLADCIEVTQAS